MKRMSILLSVLVLASVAGAEIYPYDGEVTGDNVNVRCGPGLTSYICTQLGKGARVKVLGKQGEEFLQIEAIPFTFKTKTGCLSVVASKFIRREAGVKVTSAGWGFVTEDNVLVRAGGDKRLKGFYSPQGTLKKEAKVYIIGRMTDETGSEMYLIQSPTCAKYYIAAEYVTKAAAAPASLEPVLTPADVEPKVPAVPTGDVPKPEAPVADVVAGKQAPAEGSIQDEKTILTSLKVLQTAYNAEMAKPVAQQDIKGILADAERLDVSEASEFRPYYDYMLAQIRQTLKSRQGTSEFDRIFADAMTKPAGADVAITPTVPNYDLEGVLYRSQLYSTAAATRYVVRDPKTRRILGYVEAGDAAVVLDDYCGKTVLIGGKQNFIANQALSVTKADRIKQVIDAAGPAIAAKPVDPLDPDGTPIGAIPSRPIDPIATPTEPVDPVSPNPAEGAMADVMAQLKREAEARAAAEALAAGQDPAHVDPAVPTDPIAVVPAVPVEPVAPKPVEPVAPKPVDPIATKPVEPVEPSGPIAIRTVPTEPGRIGRTKDLDAERERLLAALTGKTVGQPVVPAKPVEPVEPKPVDPIAVKPVEPKPVDPIAVKPVEPKPIDPIAVKPIEPKPIDPIEPKPIDPIAVKPIEPKPIDPIAVKPVEPKPVDPIAVKPVEPKPIDPIAVKPVEPKPIDPVAVKPVEPKPIDPSEPVEPKPVGPIAAKPVEPKPIAPRPAIAEGTPIEATVVETEFEIEWD